MLPEKSILEQSKMERRVRRKGARTVWVGGKGRDVRIGALPIDIMLDTIMSELI